MKETFTPEMELKTELQLRFNRQEKELADQLKIFELTDARTESFTRRTNEVIKIKMPSGQEMTIDEWIDLNPFVQMKPKEWEKHFPQEFYDQLYRLTGIEKRNEYLNGRPHIFARITLEIIYSRFSKSTLIVLRKLNPMIMTGLRGYRHFQFLNEKGSLLIKQYIADAISVMKDCKDGDWYSFRKELHKRFGVVYQLDLFKS